MSHAYAGALGRSAQPVTMLFEDGQFFEYYQGVISPNVEGTDSLGQSTDSVSRDYILFGAAYKTDIDDRYSLAFIVDQPWGANFEYGATSRLYGGTRAEADSLAISSLLRFKITRGLSFYGGPRLQAFSGLLELNGLAYGKLAGYKMDSDKDWALGYVGGLAYEIPTYAMRFSFTYSSSIEHDLTTRENISLVPTSTKINTPQSVNITFQTGIAENTLLFSSLRWVNWRDFEFQPAALGFPIATFKDDIVTYVIGTAYRFSPKWSGAVTLRHEPKSDNTNSLFRPTNGYTGFVISTVYTISTQIKITTGLSYTRLGDASAKTAGGYGVSFSDSDSLALGMKLSVPY
jgi:long-chain fatty acid transport protein